MGRHGCARRGWLRLAGLPAWLLLLCVWQQAALARRCCPCPARLPAHPCLHRRRCPALPPRPLCPAALPPSPLRGAQGKARLGAVVHQKNAAALALTGVKNEDQREFGKLVEAFKSQFNEGSRVQWGGGIMGMKSQHKTKQRERILAKELAQRMTV